MLLNAFANRRFVLDSCENRACCGFSKVAIRDCFRNLGRSFSRPRSKVSVWQSSAPPENYSASRTAKWLQSGHLRFWLVPHFASKSKRVVTEH
jgi:hypothetical protein